MDDVNVAKELIQSIRLAKRVDEGGGRDENANDLQNALRMLSEELYSKPTHFILELIQNADDNRYAHGVTPKLTIVYRTDGFLWIGCNEVGFTADNVRAICRIGGSTKKVEGSQKGYIGEKGIGFKSVFKIADVVWIRSRALTFRFDKTKSLGIIAPIWCEFKSNALVDDRTMFCFRIPEAQHRRNLCDDLLELQPELLLFLRQLRCIDIKILKPSGTTERAFRLERTDDVHSGIKLTSLVRQTSLPAGPMQTNKFLVCQRIAEDMPYEIKRSNVTESEVTVAFPITENFEPKLQSCLTFNFLPIRSYGLPFVLQADFILSTNREDVLEYHPWNEKLISTAMDLFVQSVHLFNEHNIAKITWMKYLQSQGSAYSTAIAGFLDQLTKRLRSESVIQSLASTMEKPAILTCPKKEYMDNGSPPHPLFRGRNGTRSYTATSYSPKDLAVLGILQMSSGDFFALLRDYITRNPTEFSQQPSSWHSRVSAAILSAGAVNVHDLGLIPLRTGRWTSASAEKVYLPNITDGLVLPIGINVEIIEDNAARDPARCSLFQKLGARQLSSAEVYRLIIEQHRAHGTNYGTWTVETVLAHAWFLFTSPSQPTNYDIRDLRVASRNSKFLHAGDDLYIDAPGSNFRICDYFGGNNNVVRYVHDQYLTYAPPDVSAKWLVWLQIKLGISTVPKLSKAGSISPEFRWIIESGPMNGWLHLIKSKWSHYAGELGSFSSDRLRSTFALAKVLCTDGRLRPLKEVYLASSSLLEEPLYQTGIPLLVVDDPKDAGWLNFQRLGLNVRPDLRFYLMILESVQGELIHDLSVKDVLRLYEGINRNFGNNQSLVRNAFASKRLIYIASPIPSQWVHLESCRWSAPDCLPGVLALRERYSTLKELFVGKLDLKDATISDVVQELENVKGQTDKIALIKDLLKALNSCMGGNHGDINVIRTLKKASKKILPVKGDTNGLRSTLDIDWFIADRERLELCFMDKVALLDFTRQEIETLSPLIAKLGLQGRGLSDNYFEKTKAAGESVFLSGLTEQMCSKATFIARLVAASKYQATLAQLATAEVWRSTTLKLRRYVLINDARVYGNDEDGWIVIKEIDASIRIYVSSKMAEKNRLPSKALAEKLVPLLEIGTEREILLLTILASDDDAEIEDALERAGIASAPSAAVAETRANDVAENEEADTIEVPTASKPFVLDIPLPRASTVQSSTTTAPDVTGLPSPQLPSVRLRPTLSRAEIPSRPMSPAHLVTARHTVTAGRKVKKPTTNGSHEDSIIEMNMSRILTAASAYHIQDVKIVTAPPSQAASNHSAFNMSSMPSALEMAPIPAVAACNPAPARVTTPRSFTRSISPAQNEATEFQQDVGYGGEVFVYQWLTSRFQARPECWTSELRSQFGLEPFAGDEIDYSDFTIEDIDVSRNITEWLVDSGLLGTEIDSHSRKTYHFEVKTTVGSWNEAFSISANQTRLAHGCHGSSFHVFAILRVYDLLGEPQIKTYVDPIAHEEAGTLSFTAQGGYLVEPK